MARAEGLTSTRIYTRISAVPGASPADGLCAIESIGGGVVLTRDLALPLPPVLATSAGASYVHGLDLPKRSTRSATSPLSPIGDLTIRRGSL
jgi:hypothetical protein